jgi:hypothetical protein
MGARTALEELASRSIQISAGSVPFCGCDGSPAYGQKLVGQGKLASTVIMPPSAGRAVSEIALMLRGAPRPAAQILLPPVAFSGERLERPRLEGPPRLEGVLRRSVRT